MGKRIYYVETGHPDDEHHDYEHDNAYDLHDLPYEKEANKLMSERGYLNYVEKHNYHFTDALADKATSLMENADGTKHNWTTNQVRSAIIGMGAKIPDSVTWGDVAYLANMYYADLFPDVLKTEVDCLKAAVKIANDVDGYKGMVFCRWTSDIIGKAVHLDWEDFV